MGTPSRKMPWMVDTYICERCRVPRFDTYSARLLYRISIMVQRGHPEERINAEADMYVLLNPPPQPTDDPAGGR